MKTAFKALGCAVTLMATAGMACAASYKEMAVANGGMITGSVSAGAVAPESKSYTISKDTGICGDGARVVNFVRVNGGMLQDAVVFLKDVDAGKAFPAELANLKITQEKCEFLPALGVMANKGELIAVNNDATLHNIHTYEQIGKARRSVINVSQPNAGDEFSKKIKLRKGDGMKVECDAHDFMHAFVFVAKNPYFAVVDDSGAFSISDVPAGKYEIVVWHGFLGEIEGGEVEVGEGGDVSVSLSY